MNETTGILKFGRGLAMVACTSLAPFGAAQAVTNILGLENPEFGQPQAAYRQRDTSPAMSCPEIKFLGNSVPNCAPRGAQGPIRDDTMEAAVWKETRHEFYLGGKGTP